MAQKANSLAHTKWMCKYHIVFTPKYRRKIVYNQYKESIRDIIKQLCAYKGVEILEGHLMPGHIHMLVSIPPKISISSFVGYLKGKSALMIFDKHANLKYKFGNRHFWAEGYYVSTVGLNEETIKKYDAVYLFDIPAQQRNDWLKLCYEKDITVYTTAKLSDILMRSSGIAQDSDRPVFYCTKFGLGTAMSILKRCLDVICCVIALLVLWPVMLLTAIAIKIEDKGRTLYSQVENR